MLSACRDKVFVLTGIVCFYLHILIYLKMTQMTLSQ